MRITTLTAICGLCVLFGASARADLRPLSRVDLSTPAKLEASRLDTDAVRALSRHQPDRALELAMRARQNDPGDGWAAYDMAAALSEMGRIEDAVAAYDEAARLFGDRDPWGHSVALFGRAHAWDTIGRCDQATRAYDEYARFVRPYDAGAAQLAVAYARGCWTAPGNIARIPSERQPVRGTERPARPRR